MAQARTTPRSGDSREGRIGRGTRVRGRVHGEGDLLIEGTLEGELGIRGDLTIAEGAEVTSPAVEAHAVTIAGVFTGDIAASGAVQLGAAARVRGNVRGAAFSMEDGARYSGRLECDFDLPPELGGPARPDTRARPAARR
jgi:cytoskeletal protein CcmA (bactofilin family)